MNLTSPVLFLIFNRPGLTREVFEKIRLAQPSELFIAADGPRPDVPEDEKRCAEAREVVKLVDWDCEVHRLFREQNLGCKRAVSSAIDWFFENVEEGIVLEDDCLPNASFFNFCSDILQYYRDDSRIMHVAGANFLGEKLECQYSYYFSYYPSIWGWATWRRAWKYYDVDMNILKECNYCVLDLVYIDSAERQNRAKLLDRVKSGEIDTWDYQWDLACRMQSGLSVIPARNLVSNIGYGQNASRTKSTLDTRMNLPAFPLGKISHPPYVVRNWSADSLRYQLHFYESRSATPTVLQKIRRSLLGILDLR